MYPKNSAVLWKPVTGSYLLQETGKKFYPIGQELQCRSQQQDKQLTRVDTRLPIPPRCRSRHTESIPHTYFIVRERERPDGAKIEVPHESPMVFSLKGKPDIIVSTEGGNDSLE